MPSQPYTERWLRDTQALIAALRDDCIAVITLDLNLLELLGEAGSSSMPYRKAAILHDRVLKPVEDCDFAKAQAELDAFLQEWPMAVLMRQSANYAKPALRAIVRAQAMIANRT